MTTFLQSTPVILSSDYGASRRFYRELLGFEVEEEGGNPAQFGIFRLGKAIVYVDAWHGAPGTNYTGWSAYIHVTGIEALAKALNDQGIALSSPLTHTSYSMVEFEVRDPDGNILCFGEDEATLGGATPSG